MSIKYYVHGGGRWRELELSSGCVSGWGRVQWVSLRRGRLVAARRWRVLQALSDLAAGRPSRAGDGPRLYREREEVKPLQIEHTRTQQQTDSHIHCCCTHLHGCKSAIEQKKTVQESFNTTVDASTQVETAVNKIVTQVEVHTNRNRKRKYSDSSIESNDHSSHINRKAQNEIRNYNRIVSRHSTSSETVVKKTNYPTKELIISEDDVSILRTCIEKNIIFPEVDLYLFDSNDEYKTLVFYRLNPLVNVERSATIKRILQARDRGHDVTLDEFVSQLGLQSVTNVKKTRRYKTRNTIRSPKKRDLIMKPMINKHTRSSDDDSINSPSVMSNKICENTRPQKRKSRQLSSSGSNTETDKENKNSNKEQTKNVKTSFNKALHLLRQKNGRFISPRKGKRSKDAKDTKSHKNMSKKPKLCLNDEVNESRPSLRDRSIVISSDSDTTVTDSNHRRVSKRLSNDKKIIESAKNTEKSGKKTDEPKKQLEKKQMELFFKKKSGSPPKKVIASKIRSRTVPRSGRVEYSTVEDAAIVRWLRAEPGRAARVNGNQLWRQLEDEYHALADTKRSWHSLRNRYLRCILPALHQLPLAPAAAAQLRAAAAQGEIKSRHRSAVPARHPLFPEPKLGASSRIQTASSSAASSPPRVTRRSLREAPNQQSQGSSPAYSEATRRFPSSKSPIPHSTPNQVKSKMRKLYNPK